MLVKKTRFLLLTFPVVLLFVWAVIALLLGLRSVVSNERMDWVFVFKMTPAIAFLLPVLLRIYLTASSRFRIVAIGGFARDVKIHIRQSVRLAEHSFQDKKLFIKEFEGSLVDKVVSVARTIRDGRSIILMVLATLTTLSTRDRKSTRLNSSHVRISYAVLCSKKKSKQKRWFVMLYFFPSLRGLLDGFPIVFSYHPVHHKIQSSEASFLSRMRSSSLLLLCCL